MTAQQIKSSQNRRTPPPKTSNPITVSIDIGGSGLKAMLLDAKGRPVSERQRVATPAIPTPLAVLKGLEELRKMLPDFDRVSVGFPGVVKNGTTLAAHNLSPKWAEFPLQETLEKLWKKPVRVANDASVQGYGAVKGDGCAAFSIVHLEGERIIGGSSFALKKV